MRYDAKWVFIVLLGVLLFLPALASAQTLGCCIYDSSKTCAYPVLDSKCTPPDQFYNQACTSLPACDTVCCVLPLSCGVSTRAACTALNGNYNNPYTSDPECTTFCNGNVLLEGYVHFQDGIPATSAQIIVDDIAGATSYPLRFTDTTGHYSVFVNKSSNYLVNATAAVYTYCSKAEPISTTTSPGPYELNLTLPCPSPSQSCVTIWNVSAWSQGTCGTRTVTDTHNCINTTYYNMPINYTPCVGSTQCGDGVVQDPPEDCEPTVLPLGKTCDDFTGANSVGTVTCSNECKYNSNCMACPTDPAQCNDQLLCTCPVCDGVQPLCAPVCNESSKINWVPEGKGAKGVYDYLPPTGTGYGKGIKISWDMPGPCRVGTTDILWCVADDAKSPTKCKTSAPVPRPKTLPGTTLTWTDFGVEKSGTKAYCYNVSTLINTGTTSFRIGPDTLACSTVWDDICIGVGNGDGNGKVCDGNQLATCVDGKLQTPLESCDCGCIAPTAAGLDARCDNKDTNPGCDICNICSGPFGVMPYINYQLNNLGISMDPYGACSDALASEPDYKGGECFSDDFAKNNTDTIGSIIGRYHACSQIQTCYDYRTKTSCESNPCGTLVTDDCKWINMSNNDELGLGVCIPKDPAQQDCSKCNDLHILGNYCPESLCMLFGQNLSSGESTCFYNSKILYTRVKIDNTSCVNKRDVACETYDTAAQCEGGVQFSENVTYINSGATRTGYDNSILTASNDSLGRGKCVWLPTEQKCIRDADFDHGFVPAPAVPGDGCSKTNPTKVDYCLDFENPNTTLYVNDLAFENTGSYSIAELKMLAAETSEQVYDTFVTMGGEITGGSVSGNGIMALANGGGGTPVEPKYYFVYPRDSSNPLEKDNLKKFKQSLEGGRPAGNYRLYYYSKDLSLNLEVLKHLDFTLLPDLSNIIVNYTLSSAYYLGSDMFLTNLTLYVNYDPAKPLVCSVNLTNIHNATQHFAQDSTKSTPNLIWNYDYLTDGEYDVLTVCTDDHLQSFVNHTYVEIDADASIHNPKPRGDTYRAGDINISIETNASAECYYTLDPNATIAPTQITPNLNMWTKYTTEEDNNTKHRSTITETLQGMRFFYSACNFNASGTVPVWYIGNGGDIIYYAIDESAPKVTLYDDSTNNIYNNSAATENVTIRFFCSDYAANLETGVKNYSFGCKDNITVSVYYKNVTTGAVVQVLPSESVADGDARYYVPPYMYVKVYLNITAEDNGVPSNVGSQQELLNIRNLSFLPPEVTICDPITGHCN